MVDTVPYEIVSYSDGFSLSFDEAYPINQLATLTVNFEGKTYYYDMSPTESFLPSGGTLATTVPQLVGNRLFAFILRAIDGTYYKESEILSTVGVCYYVISDITNDFGFPYYYKITKSDIPPDIKNPYTGGVDFNLEGDDIYLLYNFGSSLVNSSSFLGSLLNYKIGGYNLLGLLFGGGFLVYVGWSVVKWVIPV